MCIRDRQGITSKLNATTISDLAKNLTKIVVGDTEEVLRIHLVHDLINYPLLSYHVEQQFDRVLSSQVQGGIRIFVDEWDHPSDREKPEENYAKRHLNLFHGKVVDGEKLAFANLENAIKVFTKAKEEVSKQRRASVYGENEQERAQGQAQDRGHGHGHGHEHKQAQEQEQEQDDRISDVFVSILPIAVPDKGKQHEIVTTDSSHQGNFSFTIILKDITNDITSITRSQGFPTKWAEWLEGTSELKDKQTAIDERQSKGKGGDGNNAGNDKGADPRQDQQANPRGPAEHGVGVTVLGVFEDVEEQESRRNVGVQRAHKNDRGHGKGERYDLERAQQRPERRSRDVVVPNVHAVSYTHLDVYKRQDVYSLDAMLQDQVGVLIKRPQHAK